MNAFDLTEATPANRESLRVLIADDDPDARELVEMAVLGLGHTCSMACDGLEAWQMHMAKRADIIISDWKMPNMDGVALCRRVRSDDPALPYTHFIFVTGNRDNAHSLEGMLAGADDYLVKPIGLTQLEVRLEAARKAVAARRELERSKGLRV